MAAYVIASYDVVDPAGYEPYVPGVMPLLEKHGAEVLVADFEAEAREGEKRTVYVVLRFPSEGAARAWYDDPEYEPVREVRLASCDNGNVVIAKAFTAPPAA